MARLQISYSRVTARDAAGKPKAWVNECINLVHPDDNENSKGFNAFRELGMMFKGNPDYMNVTYLKQPSYVQTEMPRI